MLFLTGKDGCLLYAAPAGGAMEKRRTKMTLLELSAEYRAHAAAHMMNSARQIEGRRRLALFFARQFFHGKSQIVGVCLGVFIAGLSKSLNGLLTFQRHIAGLQQLIG